MTSQRTSSKLLYFYSDSGKNTRLRKYLHQSTFFKSACFSTIPTGVIRNSYIVQRICKSAKYSVFESCQPTPKLYPNNISFYGSLYMHPPFASHSSFTSNSLLSFNKISVDRNPSSHFSLDIQDISKYIFYLPTFRFVTQ